MTIELIIHQSACHCISERFFFYFQPSSLTANFESGFRNLEVWCISTYYHVLSTAWPSGVVNIVRPSQTT